VLSHCASQLKQNMHSRELQGKAEVQSRTGLWRVLMATVNGDKMIYLSSYEGPTFRWAINLK
jgi:hypothetical protein